MASLAKDKADLRTAPSPANIPNTNIRDKTREADILRWRILHMRHKFDHIEANSMASIPVAGATLVQHNAEEAQHAKQF